jgi:hypothetical protein
VYGENYFKTFALVVTWFSIQLLLVLLILNKWHTRQVNFVLAYTQADIEFDMYMELSAGIETKHGNGKTHCSEAAQESLWSEASQTSLEPTPYQGSQATWLQASKS